jgi:hypothetical protein
MSLGCMMEDLWLMAQSLGIGTQIMRVFSEEPVIEEVACLLAILPHLRIAFAARPAIQSQSPLITCVCAVTRKRLRSTTDFRSRSRLAFAINGLRACLAATDDAVTLYQHTRLSETRVCWVVSSLPAYRLPITGADARRA